MSPEELGIQTDTLELLNAEMAGSHDRQSDALGKIDNKAIVLVGYTLVAASFLATRHAQPVLAVLAYAAYATAAAFGVSAYAIGEYLDVDPVQLFLKYAPESKAQTLAALGAKRARNYALNQELNRKKAKRWLIGLFALVAGTSLMVAAILVQTYQHDHTRQPVRSGPAVHEPAGPYRSVESR